MGKLSSVIDPANVFGKRPGGIDMRGAMDPGGTIIKSLTGSDIGHKIADPGKLMTPAETPEAQSRAAYRKGLIAEDIKKRRLASKGSTIIPSSNETLGG